MERTGEQRDQDADAFALCVFRRRDSVKVEMFAAVMHGFGMHRIIRLRRPACGVRDIAGAGMV